MDLSLPLLLPICVKASAGTEWKTAIRTQRITSYFHIAVYDGNLLIGFIDCISNAVTDAYIQDLIVHPDYQKKGIGTQLMNRMISHLRKQNVYMISVIYDAQLSSFYQRFGFTQMLSGQLQTYHCP